MAFELEMVVRETNGVEYLECLSPITRVDDALELIAACGAAKASRLMLDAAVLPEAFFDLSTRFAGELLGKLQTYRIRVAAVIPPEESYPERFEQFLVEARRGHPFRVVDDRTGAEAWLCSG